MGDQSMFQERMFSLENVADIERIFVEADTDGGGGLDIDEFRFAMKRILGNVSDEELIALHMKIDANCDGTVDLGELTAYFLDQEDASDFKNEVFPKPFKIVSVDCNRRIAALTFCPYGGISDETSEPTEDPRQIWPYVEGHYLSISTNGVLTVWSDTFQSKCALDLCKLSKTLPLSHMTKISVTDMVFIKELKQVAVSTAGRQLLFYEYNEFPQVNDIHVAYGLNVDYVVTIMNYWSNGKKGIFSFGTDDGCLLIFISNNIKGNELFNKKLAENPSLRDYPTFYVQNLLTHHHKDYLCMRVPIFDDICKHISYFPSLGSFAVCGKSSETMALVGLSKVTNKVSKKYFKSMEGKKSFTCVAYSDWSKSLVTGGIDGVLQVWQPHNSQLCIKELEGHKKPITHVMFNPRRRIFISLSVDKKVCVWNDVSWQFLQIFQVEGLGQDKLSAAYYNTLNDELVVANINIGACLGYGTDVLQNSLTSHDKPLCNALYHSIYKQVISICQNGVVMVWDIITGEVVMRFKVRSDECVGLTAISFDEQKRRLITVSEDGIVKLWNFNNGTELYVNPITVHKKVTSIACAKDRVFMSGRNSKIIYDLNINEAVYRFLEHEYLHDISSLDVHDTKLIAAASNGNTVIWDIETSHAFLWFNINKSPQIQSLGIHNQGCTGLVSEMKTHTGLRTNVQKSKSDFPIICLKTRMTTPNTATLLTSANDYIYAWSVHPRGHLLAKFRAVNDEDAVITTMSTDEYEKTLLTGDSTGRVYLWDIQCFGYKTQTSKEPHEDGKKFYESLHPPPLLHSWQAHLTGLVSVKCDPACTKIITAGLDCNVRLWTNTGCYIGLFGKDKWDAMKVSPEGNADQVHKIEPTLDRPDTQEKTKATPPGNLRYLDNYYMRDNSSFEQSQKRCELLEGLCKEIQHLQQSIDVVLQKQPRRSQNQFKTHPPEQTSKHVRSTHTRTKNGRILRNEKPTQSQNEFKPHPPQTPGVRYGTEDELGQSSPLKHTRKTKYGRILRNQQTETLKDDVPKPNTVPGKRGPEQTSQHVRFPSIPHKVQLTGRQTQFEPLSRQISLTTGGTDMKSSLHMQQSADVVEQEQPTQSQNQFKPHPPQTPGVRYGTEDELGQSSPLKHTRKTKYGRILRNQQTETLKDDVPKPNTVPGKRGPEQTSQHVRFPSIPHKVQLTGRQTQLEPLPPEISLTMGGIDMPEQTSQHVRFPSIPYKVQLTSHPTQLEPLPTQTPRVRGGNDLKQNSPQNQPRSRRKLLKTRQADTVKGGILKPNT